MVQAIYEELARRGMVATKKAFSIEFLGKSWNYFSTVKGNVSRDALVHLLVMLRRRGEYGLMERVLGVLEEAVLTGTRHSKTGGAA